MQHYKLYSLPLCKLAMDKGAFTYLAFKYYGEKVLACVYAWLIEGGSEPILVDVGCSNREFAKYRTFSKEGGDIAPIEDSLAKFGISTSDINTVIMTHLGTDHFLNARRFPNAKFIVQEEELSFYRKPHPWYAHRCPQELYEGINFETIRGDTEIIPGVEAIFTPGHSPGGQSVAVSTEHGKVLICGLCTIDENFSAEGDILPGIHTDPAQCYDSFAKIRGIATTILPLHSQSIGERVWE